MHSIVIRGPKALARPDGSVPLAAEIAEFMVLVESYAWESVEIVTAATGTPPDGWSWVPIIQLQNSADEQLAEAIGEALLCGG